MKNHIYLVLAACHQAASAATPPPPTSVGTETTELRDIHLASELTGRVETMHHVEVRPRVSGYITAIDYREGAEVARGASLFTIDSRPYDAALAHATANLARATAQSELATLQAKRAQTLIASNVINRAEHEVALSTAAQAAAEVQAAEAAVDMARLDVEFTHVKAPLAGRSGQALVSIGDYVAAGPVPTLLTTVASVDPVYVYFTGDEPTFLRFASHAQDAPVAIGLGDETGYPHSGSIDFIDNHIDPATGTIRLRAVVANHDKRLTPGLFARVRLTEGQATPVILVNDKAVLTDQDRQFVYVLSSADTVERHDVKLGRVVDGRRVVTEGLKSGDRVIVSGVQKVFPGAKATSAAVGAQASNGAR